MEIKIKINEIVVGCGILKVEVAKSIEVEKELSRREEEIRKTLNLENLLEKPFSLYREVWWKFSMDPTKLRPSPEALVRRVLFGKKFQE